LDADVTCTEPILMKGVSRSLWIIEIALCDERTADQHLAFLPGFDVVVIFVDHPAVVSHTSVIGPNVTYLSSTLGIIGEMLPETSTS
jgi:hypothetical protein